MTQNYKRKRLIEENCSDNKTTYIRKSLNSSERFNAKKEIKKTIDTRHDMATELRWELEMQLSSECHQNELFGPHLYIQDMLALLDIGDFDLYKCTCIDVHKLKDEEVLKIFGL
jgi:hypothetical protein